MAAQGGRARQLAEILAGLEQQLLPLLSPDGADAGAARGSRGICESGSVSGSAPALFDEVSQTRFLSDDVSDASYAEGEEGDLHLVKDAPGEDGRAALSPAPRQPRPLTSDVLNCTSADGGRLSQGSRLTGSFPSQEEALVPDTPSPPRSQHPEPILRGEPSQEDSALIRTSSKRSAGTKWTASIESRMSRNERLELLELWQDSDENDALIALALQATRSEMSLDWSMNITPKLSKTLSKSMKTLMVSRSSSRGFDKFFHKFTTSPVSSRRIMWECLGMLFVMYDVLFTPFEQAFFDNSASYAVLVLEGATLAYWCADLPSNFVVGYYDVRGSSRSKVPILQTSMRSIAMHYVQGWFIPDIFLLVISAISFLHAAQARCPGQLSMKFSYIAWAQSGRAIRVLKFFKLLRALKAHSVIARMREKVVSFATKTYLKVLMHLLWIVTANHYLACWWYQIGCSPDDSVVGVPSWVEANFQAADSISYRYFTSFHWSLTQFTPASMEVVPKNATERGYTCAVVLAALIVFSSFVGSITEALTRLRKSTNWNQKKTSELQVYMCENEISHDLAMRVMTFVKAGSKLANRRKLGSEVDFLKALPVSLQRQVRQEVVVPTIIRHPLLQQLTAKKAPAMVALSITACQEQLLSPSEVLFHVGQMATAMYFVNHGLMELALPGSRVIVDHGSKVSWMCEAAMWAKWVHTGTASAKTHSVVFGLPVDKAHATLRQQPDTLYQTRMYAQRYVSLANSVAGDGAMFSDYFDELAQLQALAESAFSEDGLARAASSAASPRSAACPEA